MDVREKEDKIGTAMLAGLRTILGEKFHGFYVYGAAAFPDNVPTGDVDFHVILTGPLSDEEKSKIDKLHKHLADEFPPLGGETDGYYLLLGDARKRENPKSQMWREATDESWALHREHILAGRCIVLHGPDPKEIYQTASRDEIKAALLHEFQYVKENLTKYPDYSILQLCRLMYSFDTEDVVVSKANAANWAYQELPEWRKCIDMARKSYARKGSDDELEYMKTEVKGLFDKVADKIKKIS